MDMVSATEEEKEKEKESEDWCFVCKDGGDLIICEHPHCTKVYHPAGDCMLKGKSVRASGDGFICKWHTCYLCNKESKLWCLCCPFAVCRGCAITAEFSCIKGNKGLCIDCMDEVLTLEEIREYDPAGIDLKDPNTLECLFLEYWDVMKGLEGLTVEDVRSAGSRKKVTKRKYNKHPKFSASGSETWEAKECKSTRRKKRMEFIGWGSKPLIEFLNYIGKDTNEKMEQSEVDLIVRQYIVDKNLLDDQKKKVCCDEKLRSIFRRKSVRMKSIYYLLERHFKENLEPVESEVICLEEEEERCFSEKRENVVLSCKKRKTERSNEKIISEKKEVKPEFRTSGFASINADNIKLVYLRKSLIEDLSKKYESFEDKVVGSFVKVKNDPRDRIQRNLCQILQVTAVKRISTSDEQSRGIVLNVSGVSTDIRISKLDDSDITEEEIEDLKQKVMNGLLRQPTVVEMERKAKLLHEDITRHWIARQLVILRNRINYVNEKGRRGELSEYLEQRDLLEKPEEQERLLRQVPRIMEDIVEIKTTSMDSSSKQWLSSDLTEEVIEVFNVD